MDGMSGARPRTVREKTRRMGSRRMAARASRQRGVVAIVEGVKEG